MRWQSMWCAWGKRNAYGAVVGKPEGKGSCGRPAYRLEYNIRMDITEIGWSGVDWI
jgi:hypothetical protein